MEIIVLLIFTVVLGIWCYYYTMNKNNGENIEKSAPYKIETPIPSEVGKSPDDRVEAQVPVQHSASHNDKKSTSLTKKSAVKKATTISTEKTVSVKKPAAKKPKV